MFKNFNFRDIPVFTACQRCQEDERNYEHFCKDSRELRTYWKKNRLHICTDLAKIFIRNQISLRYLRKKETRFTNRIKFEKEVENFKS